MKKITIILILIILITGCRSAKKVTESTIQAKIETVTKTENKVADQITEQKNLNIETVTTITETEYNKPDSDNSTKGAVKSTKTTVIKTIQTDKGKIETEHKQEVKTEGTQTEAIQAKDEVTEKKTVRIQSWAIFGILLIISCLSIYFRKLIIKWVSE